jgi:glycosyltransferase involved in cell wall biosynthesis
VPERSLRSALARKRPTFWWSVRTSLPKPTTSRCAPSQRLELGQGLHRLAQELGVTSRVKFVAQLPDTEVVSLLQAATALLQPSLAEGFGLPALEAIACGTPVIASDIPPLREVLGEAGTFAAAGDAHELSLAIKRLAGDAELRQELSARGLERAKRFSWDTTARLTWEAYRDVARSS